MARRASHRWAFGAGMRARALGWNGSAKAIDRLKLARSEILAVNRVDPVTAAGGVVLLAERIWPAFEQIDTSTGALGTAVRRTLEDLIPVLVDAPADEATRAGWLERLRQAICDDGVDYLAPISDAFGRIAAIPALIREHADRDLDLVRAAVADRTTYIHVPTGTLTLSCLLEAGRHEDLLALLDLKKTRLWFDERFAAEALVRQGREDAALARASALLEGPNPWGRHDIARFCEDILIRQGRAEEAWRRFALPFASRNTFLATWRDLVRRHPDRAGRAILQDLIALHGRPGKWFATAKTAGCLDIALACAADPEADPATLVRAARDFTTRDPAFATEVALQAIRHLCAGRGYEPDPMDIDRATDHLTTASRRLGRTEDAMAAVRAILTRTDPASPMARRLQARIEVWEREGRVG